MIEQTGSWETRTAEEAESGERLDKWLSSWTELSRSRIRSLVETGNVRADGNIISKVTTKVRPDIEYAVRVPPPVDDTPQPEDIPLDILFEDDHLIVLNKSSGMTVHPAPGSRSATLVNALLFHCADTSTASIRTHPASWSRPRPIKRIRVCLSNSRNIPLTGFTLAL